MRYVDPPDVPEGMTIAEYRRRRPWRKRRRLLARGIARRRRRFVVAGISDRRPRAPWRVVSQLLGYTLAKYVGTKVVSEAGRARRMWMLIGLIAFAEFALLLFAILPPEWKVAAIFLNGFPLGMVFGLVVRYLEGRRTSDILLAGLACSFIIASGVFKDIGRALLAGDAIRFFSIPFPNPFPPLSEFWMPVATGLLFAPRSCSPSGCSISCPNPRSKTRPIAPNASRCPARAAASSCSCTCPASWRSSSPTSSSPSSATTATTTWSTS